jgi:arylsulfatase
VSSPVAEWSKRAKRVLAILLILVVGRWVLQQAGGAQRGHRRTAAWQPSLVIYLAIDTLRADYVGCYGNPLGLTPNIDRLAAQGVVFDRAYSQSNRTLVSFSSLMTGLYPPLRNESPHELENWHLAADYPTLASVASSYGAHTAGFVTSENLRAAFGFNHGFDSFRYSPDSLRGLFDSVMDWLDAARPALAAKQKHFLFVHSNDVHTYNKDTLEQDHLLAPGYHGTADAVTERQNAGHFLRGRRFYAQAFKAQDRYFDPSTSPAVELTDADIAHIRSTYAGGVSYADAYVGILLQRLRRLQLQDDTLLILFGDHGENLLEDDASLGHGQLRDLRDSLTHVPLIVWAPGSPLRPGHVGHLVELVDATRTVFDCWNMTAKVKLPGSNLFDVAQRAGGQPWLWLYALSGASPQLFSLGAASDSASEGYSLSVDPGYGETRLSLRSARYRYEESRLYSAGAVQEELFEEANDPYHRRNLATDPQRAAVLAELRAVLRERLREGDYLVHKR